MPKPVRIGVVGAGSATFSLGLVKDLCLTENLAGSEVAFMDIDAERLDAVTKMAERYADEVGVRLRFEQTTDLDTSLKGCDFVINTAMVQSHHLQRQVREMLDRYGYYYGGASLGSYYQFELMLNVARSMERICPDAWLIQSGNPVFDGCTLMTRETDIKVCGLCHGHYGYLHIADVLGLEHDRVGFQAPGVNHCIWMTHFLYDGEDAYPKIDEWIQKDGPTYWETHVATGTHDIQLSRGAVHQYRMYGLFPIGDSPRMCGWWYHTDLETKKWWFGDRFGGPDTEIARPVHVERLEKRMAEIREAAADSSAKMTDVFGTERTREQQVPIIDALTNDVEGQFQVNVPNYGAIEGIDDDVVVEVPAVINAKGIQPLRVGALPKKIMLEQLLPTILKMEVGLEAYKTGDRSMLLYNILENHKTRSYDVASTVLDELLAMDENAEAAAHFALPWPDGEADRFRRPIEATMNTAAK